MSDRTTREAPLIYPDAEMEEKTRRAEYAEATRQALVDAGRRLFAERGFAETSTEEIVRQARVTRGALYHHFDGKAELFRAVVEELEQELVEQIMGAAMSSPDPWGVMTRGCDAFLDACLDPGVQRILLLDAPAVLGLEAWREIDARYSVGTTMYALQGVMDAGAIEKQPLEPLAHMLLGALHEAAHYIADSPDPQKARAEIGATMLRLLEGIRVR